MLSGNIKKKRNFPSHIILQLKRNQTREAGEDVSVGELCEIHGMKIYSSPYMQKDTACFINYPIMKPQVFVPPEVATKIKNIHHEKFEIKTKDII